MKKVASISCDMYFVQRYVQLSECAKCQYMKSIDYTKGIVDCNQEEEKR
jgi:hypothetical protein